MIEPCALCQDWVAPIHLLFPLLPLYERTRYSGIKFMANKTRI